MKRYSRNRIYLSKEEQMKIKNFRILLGGAGIGSVIVECALRFGFECITIVDGDKVEMSNLNRQNYVNGDVGKYKAECLGKRLKRINPQAEIHIVKEFINNDNIDKIISEGDIAINALDFTSNIPFLFDKKCSERGLYVLHPYNLGWAGMLTIIRPDGYPISELSNGEYKEFELKVAEYVSRYSTFWNIKKEWLENVIKQYKKEKGQLPPPQLSVASWIIAGHCVNAMFNIATGRSVKCFPQFYMSSLLCD